MKLFQFKRLISGIRLFSVGPVTSLALLSVFFIGGCEITNSFSSDKALTGGETSAGILAINRNCFSCHTHSAWQDYSEADFISNNLVVPGDPENSLLWQRIDDGSMPPSGALGDSDKAIIQDWIQNLPPATE